jgi:hypothetical protein
MRMTSLRRRIEAERQRQPRLGADRMMRFELRDLVLRPSGVAVRFRHLEADARGRISAHQFPFDAPLGEMPKGDERAVRDVRRECVKQRDDKLLRHRCKLPVAVRFANAFEQSAAFQLRGGGETAEARRAKILGERG